jgi:hypothetical protein
MLALAAATGMHEPRTGLPRAMRRGVNSVGRAMARTSDFCVHAWRGMPLWMPRRQCRARHQQKAKADKRS